MHPILHWHAKQLELHFHCHRRITTFRKLKVKNWRIEVMAIPAIVSGFELRQMTRKLVMVIEVKLKEKIDHCLLWKTESDLIWTKHTYCQRAEGVIWSQMERHVVIVAEVLLWPKDSLNTNRYAICRTVNREKHSIPWNKDSKDYRMNTWSRMKSLAMYVF